MSSNVLLKQRLSRAAGRSAADSPQGFRDCTDASCSLLRNHLAMDGSPILICYDGSADAQRAIKTAATLLGSRRAVVLDIAPLLTSAESIAAMSSVVPGDAFEETNVAEARRVAERGAEIALASGFEAEARGDLAEPTWQGIVDVADELHALLIVIGSRGLGGLREIIEGSMSHQVAEHAGRPVLVVPPPHKP